MAWALESNWKPTRLMEVAAPLDTSTGATEVATDAGRAYIKVMGNRQGTHVLATDWVGTHLAKWFGLDTFDIAILPLGDDDTFPLHGSLLAQPGPAFAACAVAGEPWGSSASQLDLLVNPDDITRLVVFDTWTLNCDRHDCGVGGRKPNYDNVFLAYENEQPTGRRLIAMDHGLCFIRSNEDLTERLADIDKVKDDRIYGLFPEFHNRLMAAVIDDCVEQLGNVDSATVDAVIATVPIEWDVSVRARKAWRELICRRADFVAENIHEWIDKAAPWFGAAGE